MDRTLVGKKKASDADINDSARIALKQQEDDVKNEVCQETATIVDFVNKQADPETHRGNEEENEKPAKTIEMTIEPPSPEKKSITKKTSSRNVKAASSLTPVETRR